MQLVYWMFEPVTLGSGSLPLPYLAINFLDTYPKIGVVLFGTGLLFLLHKRTVKLWWFAAPIFLSGILLVLAVMLGDIYPTLGPAVALGTLAVALALTVYAFFQSRTAWPAGLFFAAACLCMLPFQGLYSLMLLSGQYI